MALTNYAALAKAQALLGGQVEADLFQRACDILWLSRIYNMHIEDCATEMLHRITQKSGSIFWKDTTYTERVWINKYNPETKEVDESCYYDCFLRQFVVIK